MTAAARRPHTFLEWTLYAVMVAALTAAVIVVSLVVWAIYFNDPPISITSLDPDPLGVLCGGDEMVIHNDIEVRASTIVIFYVSTMTPGETKNMIGTQRAFTDLLYPHPTEFRQELPWVVPDLPPGQYVRVVAARNVEGAQKTVFSKRQFEIGLNCLKEKS